MDEPTTNDRRNLKTMCFAGAQPRAVDYAGASGSRLFLEGFIQGISEAMPSLGLKLVFNGEGDDRLVQEARFVICCLDGSSDARTRTLIAAQRLGVPALGFGSRLYGTGQMHDECRPFEAIIRQVTIDTAIPFWSLSMASFIREAIKAGF